MSLKARITEDMKNAMRSGEKDRLGLIRMLQAGIKQREVDERIELDDAQVLSVIDKMIKQRRDSVTQFEAGGRADLVAKESAEIGWLTDYLPAQLSEADVSKVHAGMPVYFTLIGDPDTRYQARLRTVELAPTNINDQTTSTSGTNVAVYYYALFDVANPDHALRVAMTTQVTIVRDRRQGVLTIPRTALGKRLGPGEYQVQRLTGDVPQTLTIKTGLQDEIKVEVLAGLEEGDRIALNDLGASPTGEARQ